MTTEERIASRLPDLRFVYYDWGGPLRQFNGVERCKGHRWTVLPLDLVRAARRAGLPRFQAGGHVGTTVPAYCERCGVIKDQRAARRLRWRAMTMLGRSHDHIREAIG